MLQYLSSSRLGAIHDETFNPSEPDHRAFVTMVAYMYICGASGIANADDGLKEGAEWKCKALFKVSQQAQHCSSPHVP